MVGDDLAAQGAKLRDEGRGHGPRAAAGHRPAVRVGDGPQHKPEARRERASQRHHRMGTQAAEQRAGLVVAEPPPGQGRGGEQRRQPEAGERERMSGKVDDRSEELREQLRAHRAPVAGRAPARPSRPARGREPCRPRNGGAPPSAPRRAGARRARPGEPIPPRGPRGPATRRTATRPRPRESPSRHRGRSPAASARPTASRRPASRPLRTPRPSGRPWRW